MIKLDLHVHSKYSKDGFEEIPRIFARAKKLGLDGVAITDHNNTDSYREAKEVAKREGMIFIQGVEISSKDGDIIALGVTEEIPKGLSAEETIKRIHEYKGVAIAAHPFGMLYHRNSVGKLARRLPFDAVEGINARCYVGNNIANKIDKPQIGCSDAHILAEIGSAYTEIDSDRTTKNILQAIRDGKTQAKGKSIRAQNVMKYAVKRSPSLAHEKLSGMFSFK